MTIAILIMAVFVVGAGVLLFTTPGEEEPFEPTSNISSSESPELPDEGSNTSVSADTPPVSETPSEPPEETETPTPTPKIISVDITYAGVVNDDFTEPVGKEIPVAVRIEPAGVEVNVDIEWTTSDPGVFEVVKTNTEGTNAKVTIIGTSESSWATLTVIVGDLEDTCIVRVGR